MAYRNRLAVITLALAVFTTVAVFAMAPKAIADSVFDGIPIGGDRPWHHDERVDPDAYDAVVFEGTMTITDYEWIGANEVGTDFFYSSVSVLDPPRPGHPAMPFSAIVARPCVGGDPNPPFRR
ncbi:MAG: hypothetical protein R2823_02905 [Acidimicrobiia bacterium]